MLFGIRPRSRGCSRHFNATSSNRNRRTKESNALINSMALFTTIEPIGTVLSKITFFKNGLSRLKVDFLNSLHIQEAELTRQHLLTRIRRDYERRRQRLRVHEKHGIHIVDESGRELAFLPSNSYAHPTKRTKNNSPLLSHNPSSSSLSGNYLTTRRPQEHLRQISRDLQITLPTVAAFLLVPFVGYSFVLLGMMFPRLLLSRQFHTREQRWEFATKEYGERRAWYGRLNVDFWGSCMRTMPDLALCRRRVEFTIVDEQQQTHHFENRGSNNAPLFLEPLSYLEMDAAGPVFSKQSMYTLYNLFQCVGEGKGVAASESPSIQSLQPTHLHALALSNNLASPMLLPSNLAPTFLQTCIPSTYLQLKLRTLAEDIIMDDSALIEEGQLDGECSGMTEEEILDACWLRGLPVGSFAQMKGIGVHGSAHGREGEVHVMRRVLTNHLQMMEAIMAGPSMDTASNVKETALLRSKRELVRDTRLQLLVLHLPAIRYSMRKD